MTQGPRIENMGAELHVVWTVDCAVMKKWDKEFTDGKNNNNQSTSPRC